MTILEEYKEGTQVKVVCRCDCGNTKTFFRANILPKKNCRYTVSCGCKRSAIVSEKNSTHKMTNSPFYRRWTAMFARSYSKNYINSSSYVGISVCKRWHKFENFKTDMYDSFLEHSSKNNLRNVTLDRIDVLGNYCKENCRWATQKEQSINKKNTIKVMFEGKYIPLKTVCENLGKDYNSIYHRMQNGKTLEEALYTKLWTRTKMA